MLSYRFSTILQLTSLFTGITELTSEGMSFYSLTIHSLNNRGVIHKSASTFNNQIDQILQSFKVNFTSNKY